MFSLNTDIHCRSTTGISFKKFKGDYDGAVAERKAQGVVPKPLDPESTSKLVHLLQNFQGDTSTAKSFSPTYPFK